MSWGLMIGAGRAVLRTAWWTARVPRARDLAHRARAQPGRRRPERRARPRLRKRGPRCAAARGRGPQRRVPDCAGRHGAVVDGVSFDRRGENAGARRRVGLRQER